MLVKDIETLNHEKKIRGFFTVTVYIFAVSFLAILLSIYYLFVWTNPNIQAYCWYMTVRAGPSCLVNGNIVFDGRVESIDIHWLSRGKE
jgi:hypothetical protein